jgi:hypothetical protein
MPCCHNYYNRSNRCLTLAIFAAKNSKPPNRGSNHQANNGDTDLLAAPFAARGIHLVMIPSTTPFDNGSEKTGSWRGTMENCLLKIDNSANTVNIY